MPSAVPCRSGVNQRETNGTPAAKLAPAVPRKNAPRIYVQYELAKPKKKTGSIVNSSRAVNTLRPPKRSVRIPTGTRMMTPSNVGTAISRAIAVLSSLNSAWISRDSGEMMLHATNATVNAAVASARLR
jgi:hypothetical protein